MRTTRALLLAVLFIHPSSGQTSQPRLETGNAVGAEFQSPDRSPLQRQLLAELARLGATVAGVDPGDELAIDLSKGEASARAMPMLAQIDGLSTLKMSRHTTDHTLAHLEQITGLKQLYLYDAQITDAGLVRLADMVSLKELHLNGTGIGDAGLKQLTKLVNLEVLNLTNTKATDVGLQSLRQLQSLRKLSIRGTSITISGVVGLYTVEQRRGLLAALDALDAVTRNERGEAIGIDVGGTEFGDREIAHLTQLPTLKQLHLSSSLITDAGMVHLAKLGGLETLDLAKCDIGDAGLSHISGLEHLQSLNLYGTKTTTAGIEHLMGLTRLKTLYITDLKLSAAAVDRLKQAIPGLTVTDFIAQ